MEVRGYLVAESDAGSGRRVPVGKSIILGRTSENGFVIDDSGASRQHVEITHRDGAFYWEEMSA